MNNNDYLEKVLGEQYNMKNYFVDTYTEPHPQVNVVETSSPVVNETATDKTAKNEEITSQASESEGKSEEQIAFNEITTNDQSKPDIRSAILDKSDSTKETSKDIYIEDEINQPEPNIEPKMTEFSYEESKSNDLKKEQPRQYQAIQVSKEIGSMYPPIYQAIDPIVELSVANMNISELNEDDIDNITTRIFNAVEPSTIPTSISTSTTIPARGRPHNNLLYDLIKILILNKLAPMPPRPPHHNHRPQVLPPLPPMHGPNSMRVSNNISYQDVPYPEDMV